GEDSSRTFASRLILSHVSDFEDDDTIEGSPREDPVIPYKADGSADNIERLPSSTSDTVITNNYSGDHIIDRRANSSNSERSSPRASDQFLFSCSECGECFTGLSTLLEHHQTHTGEGSFICLTCGKCFKADSEQGSTGKNNFSSSECKECLSQKPSQGQKRAHLGEKPFICAECGRCFAWQSALSRHELTHSGERRFHCLECGRNFEFRGHGQAWRPVTIAIERLPLTSWISEQPGHSGGWRGLT
ncbi:hypothetical protein AB205_0170110, partial [Aquarana catesbeiana]